MSDTAQAVGTAAVSAALSTAAGFLGGPLLAAAVGFVSGLPVQLVTASCLAAMIWFDPMIGVWLTIAAIAAVGGFILGVLRKPHPVLYRKTSRDDGSQRIAHLEAKLAQASDRERALLAALTDAYNPRSPAALAAPRIRGQVTR
jgi:hypothetical protein